MKNANVNRKPNALLIQMLEGAGVAYELIGRDGLTVKLGETELTFDGTGELVCAIGPAQDQAA